MKIMNTKEKKYGLFYGTLRAKGYNFNRFGGQTPIRTFTLEGYNLYDCGLPMVTKGDSQIVVELHELTDQSDNYIRRMEFGAGYKEEKIKLDEGEASLYVYPPEAECIRRSSNRLVKSGDWIAHETTKKRV
jgi:gamma-glutamylcyclotransferase (GGCT)/AIG2-like uncharacterized protein YtfP